MTERVGTAIVGGGPAGAVLAARLAAAGEPVVVLERAPAWRWRAGGVFTSPAAVAALRRAGLPAATLAAVARPIPAMRVETLGGTTFRLTYGADDGGEPAVGFDRSGLDPALLDLAERAGADVRRGWHVTVGRAGRRPARGPPTGRRRGRAGGSGRGRGRRAALGRGARRGRRPRCAPRPPRRADLPPRRPGATSGAGACRDARMRVIRDGYVGIAPVPGGRVNVGIVLGRSWRAALARDGARSVASSIVAAVPPTAADPAAWRAGEPLDRIEGAWPLGHRVTRRAGERWLLVGDAAGFLDPFTGEGLHRALVSAELAAAAIRRPGARPARRLRRLRPDDAPPVPGQGRRVVARPGVPRRGPRCSSTPPGAVADRDAVRATMGLVMGDLVPAGRALDPRFLAALLAP